MHAGSVVTKNVSITYRGSIDENSWETRYLTFVAGIVRGDPRRLCQSATASSSHTTPSRTHLPDHG
ncbi:hypothetical protein EMIT0196MI5_100138 [Pseudomonas sp. IT-196MI5]